MFKYELNYDLLDEESEKYQELEKGLNILFDSIEDGEVDSTYDFECAEKYAEVVKNKIEKFFAKSLAMKFRVTNVDNGGVAYGETELSHMKRLAEYRP